jgi:His/Glu/Gln/Arg/opine family amino acid ABC transporter permease subunit
MEDPMTTVSIDQKFGPFAPDQRAPIPIARGALWLGVAALVLAVVRPVVENVQPRSDLAWMRLPGMVAGILAVAVSLVALYRVSTEGLRGRGLALIGAWLGAVAVLIVIVYAATVDGNLRLARFFHYYFNLHILRVITPDLARGAVNTVKAAFLAEVIAVAAGLIIATLRMSKRTMIRLPAVWYIDVVRGLPLIVMGSLVAYGLPAVGITLGTFAVVVTALVINAAAYVAEIFRAGIQSLPRGQMDAARSLGMTQGAAMTSVVIPQAFRAVIPPLMNEFIALIKDTAIIFAIAGVTVGNRDIYTAAQAGAGSTFSPTPFIGASIGYLIITIPLSRFFGRAERRLRAGLT